MGILDKFRARKIDPIGFAKYVIANYSGSLGLDAPTGSQYEVECERLKRECSRVNGEHFSQRIYLLNKAGGRMPVTSPEALYLKIQCYQFAGASGKSNAIKYAKLFLNLYRNNGNANMVRYVLEDLEGNKPGAMSALNQEVKKKTLSNAKALGTDLLVIDNNGCVCAECAKYRHRVYSISGKDRRFPKYPQFLIDNPSHCGQIAFPFIYGVNSMQYDSGKDVKDVIRHSNRPFVDDRTSEERERFKRWSEQSKRELEEFAARELDRKHYYWLQQYAPETCPKSFGAYRRMKSTNSKNFQKLCAEAEKLGRNLLE